MEVALSLLSGVISGILASVIFLFLLRRKKPKIRISSYISKTEFNGGINYFFKFINKTNSEIFDVHIEAILYSPINQSSGRNLIAKEIHLADGFSAYIPQEKRNDDHNLHCIRIRTEEDLLSKWKSDSSDFLRLTVIAKHAISGFNQVFIKDFLSIDCITEKQFKSGNSLDVE